MISYGKQTIDQSDIDAAVKVLKGDWLTQGPYVDKFEEDLTNYFGTKHACVVSNGTAALHLAGIALGWGPGDVVITTPITFLSTANCIVFSGAQPDFVDIDSKTYTLDINLLEDKIKKYNSNNKKVKAIIGVDYAGYPCAWKEIRYIADKYNVQLINDNCHALGASYYNDKQYAAKYADLVIHSYHPVKHITTGEGGAILTNNPAIDKKVRLLRTHGMSKDVYKKEDNDGPWYYEMHEIGYNYRITDFQSAIGSNQLKKLDNFIYKRTKISKKYNKAFKGIECLTIPFTESIINHAYHLYPLKVDFKKINFDKATFFNKMKSFGITLQVHYIPIHSQPYYRNKYGFKIGDFSNAENFYKSEFSIPIYPNLTNDEINFIIDSIYKTIKL